jgi:hypothetical protein
MSQHDEELARLRAQLDQAKEATKELAGTLWSFYSALVEEGFDGPAALSLTNSFLGAMFLANGGES